MQVAVHRTKFCRVHTIHRAAERPALLSDGPELFFLPERLRGRRQQRPARGAISPGSPSRCGPRVRGGSPPPAATHRLPRALWEDSGSAGGAPSRGSGVAMLAERPARRLSPRRWKPCRAMRRHAAEPLLDAGAARPGLAERPPGGERCRGWPPRWAPSSPPLRGGNNERGDTGAAPEEGSGLGSTLAQAASPWRPRDQHLPAATRAGAARTPGIHPRGVGASREAGPDPHLRLGGAGGGRGERPRTASR